MKEELNKPKVWPPAPMLSPNGDIDAPEAAPHKILTGVAWLDILFGVLLSLILFPLFTVALFNPIAAALLSFADKVFPSEARLLTGWFCAGCVQFFAYKLACTRRFRVLGNTIMCAGVALALILLLLILAACYMFGYMKALVQLQRPGDAPHENLPDVSGIRSIPLGQYYLIIWVARFRFVCYT